MRMAQSSGENSRRAGADGGARWLRNPYVLLVFRLFLAAIFIYAAVQKIGKPLAFADEIRSYSVIDYGPPLYIMAVVLPWLELVCGLSLATGLFVRGSALILLGLSAMFLAVVAKKTAGFVHDGMPFMKVFFDCGCGFGATFAWKKLLEDAVYLLVAAALLFAPLHRFTLSFKGGRRG
jgi:putative oxidoreductase